jgi:thiol-disulfide isomerase/thioredoxin
MQFKIKQFTSQIFIAYFTVTYLSCCNEVGPPIDFTPVDETLTDTTYVTDSVFTPQPKVVLLEDFTGQLCPNCPSAHVIIEEIIAEHGDAVAAVAHYNYFADISAELEYVTDEAIELGNYLGPVSAWPLGAVDRVDFGSGVLILKDLYAASVDAQLTTTPLCNIHLSTEYDAATRKLNVTVGVKYTADVFTANHLSVMLCENKIIDFQDETSSGEIVMYEHNHVLRKMLTLATGNALNEENLMGRVYWKEFSITLPEDWVKENLDVIAFVHNFETDTKEVLQTALLHLD